MNMVEYGAGGQLVHNDTEATGASGTADATGADGAAAGEGAGGHLRRGQRDVAICACAPSCAAEKEEEGEGVVLPCLSTT